MKETEEGNSQQTQLTFYDETNVLGVQTKQEIQKEKNKNIPTVILEILGKTYTFILSQYSRVLR